MTTYNAPTRLARNKMLLAGALLLVTADQVPAQAVGCSDVVTRIALEAGGNASAGGPLAALLHAGRGAVPDPNAAIDDICRFALTGGIQNPRSRRDAVAAVLSRLVNAGRNDSAVQYGLAASRNQRGLFADVLADSSVAGSADPLVRYEFARAQFLAGSVEDGLRVLRGVVTQSSAAAILLLHSSHAALSSEARRRIERVPLAERGTEVLEAWEQMAWSSGLTLAERLGVHFERVVHADSMYFGVGRASADSTEVITSGRAEPDPRREIYIRFGEPWQIVHTPIVRRGTASANAETWAFSDPTRREPMVFHFTGANTNYSLIASLGCNTNWLADRATLTPRLGQMFQACTTGSPEIRAVVASHRRETLDDYDRNLDREFVLPARLGARFTYQLYTFGSPATSSDEVVAVVLVPAEEVPGTGGLRAGVFLRDESGSVHSQLTDHSLAEQGDVMVVVTIPDVPEGDYSYRVRMSDLEFREGFVYGGEYTVALDGKGNLRMSDLVIAKAGATGALRRATETLQPILGAISEREFDLYGEAYGLSAGEAVGVEITVSRDRGLFRRATEIALRFSDTAGEDGRLTFRRSIQHDLEPGRYELAVRLRSVSAGSPEQKTIIEIR